MKIFKLVVLLFLGIMFSCSTVRVVSDYDTKIDFSTYKTFAFYKKGIDKASVSDLDKKRIMRAIEGELVEKGFSKSENPDLLISIFTKSREQVNVSDNNFGYGLGWGYNPWFFGSSILLLLINIQKGLYLLILLIKRIMNSFGRVLDLALLKMSNIDKKEERINQFVQQDYFSISSKSKKVDST